MARYARLTSGVTKTKMRKQKSRAQSVIHRLRSAPLLFIAALFAAAGVTAAIVHADTFQDQIDALNAQNAQTQGSLNTLQAQASSYQDAINKLQQQIAGLQAAIDANQAKQVELQAEIDAAEAKLEQQRKGLAQDLKAMYVSGQMSTVEMLATSKSLSSYVDAETYKSAVQNKIQATVTQITQLQLQLKAQKDQVQQLITEQQQQQASLAGAQAEQQNLLAMNESQQAAYNQQIQSNNSQIASLRAQQLAANRALGGQVVAGDPGHGGYPANWDSPVPQDSLLDSWGMLNRECVSYTAWKVYQTYGYMPYWGGMGNANQWPGDAQRAGIPIGSTPRVHSVAIWNVGAFGHAMWVEAVSGNTIYVSQYNYDYNGHYSEMSISASGLTYIYFGQ